MAAATCRRTCSACIRLRRENPALRPIRFARLDERTPSASRRWTGTTSTARRCRSTTGRIPSHRTLQYVAASTPEFEEFNRILLIVHGNERPIEVTLPDIDGRDALRLAVVERRRGASATSTPVYAARRQSCRSPARRCICSAPSDASPTSAAPPVAAPGGAVGSRRGPVDAHRSAPAPGAAPRPSPSATPASGSRTVTPRPAASRSRSPSPSVPWGTTGPRPSPARSVPFRVTAFREGHDLIGVHVRLTSPSGDVSLHRLSPLNDGFDRWQTLRRAARAGHVALPLRGLRRRLRDVGARRRPQDRGGGGCRAHARDSARGCSTAPWPRSPGRSPSGGCSRGPPPRFAIPRSTMRAMVEEVWRVRHQLAALDIEQTIFDGYDDAGFCRAIQPTGLIDIGRQNTDRSQCVGYVGNFVPGR